MAFLNHWLGKIFVSLFSSSLITLVSFNVGFNVGIDPAFSQEKSKIVHLRVGVVGSPPFVVYDSPADGDITGISVEIWKNIAIPDNWQSEYIPQINVKKGLEAISAGDLDVLIGSISITPSRVSLPNISFTQPYFASSVGVMVSETPPSVWQRIAPFFGIAALSSLGGLILLIFIVGNLIWLVEHRKNPEHFSPNYPQGLENGMWFALVTLTTVGYGDRFPVTKLGKAIASVWMLMALLTFSSITAGLASALTAAFSESQRRPFMTQTSELAGASVAVVKNTTSETWAEFYHARSTNAKNLPEAIALLKAGKVEAVLFDRPVLMYYAKQHPDEKLEVTDMRLAIEPYGFVLQADSPIEKTLNIHLLNLIYSKEMERLTERWLGEVIARPST